MPILVDCKIWEADAITVEIPPELQQFVRSVIDSGSFKSEAEVVGEGLRLLRERRLYELRKDIDAAAEQLDRGEGIELRDQHSLREFFDHVTKQGTKRREARHTAR